MLSYCDRIRISNDSASVLVGLTIESLGHDLDDFHLCPEFIRQARQKNRVESSTSYLEQIDEMEDRTERLLYSKIQTIVK